MGGKRALTEEAKHEKREHIMDTAYCLLCKKSFQDIKMVDIAKESSVSKGTLFNYFCTKEHLFACLLIREYHKRYELVQKKLSGHDRMDAAESKRFVLEEFESLLDGGSPYIRMERMKTTILEKNMDRETTVKVKRAMFRIMEEMITLIAGKSCMEMEMVEELIMAQNAILVGYANLSVLPVNVVEAIDELGLSHKKVDFRKEALRAMEYYLDGMMSSCQESKRLT